jgi:pimeloyl-ACP methyl ester carboxylesterase
VRTSLVYTTEDEFFTPEWERFVAQELLGVEPIELPGGHFPMLEQPDQLTDILDRLAAEAIGSADACGIRGSSRTSGGRTGCR